MLYACFVKSCSEYDLVGYDPGGHPPYPYPYYVIHAWWHVRGLQIFNVSSNNGDNRFSIRIKQRRSRGIYCISKGLQISEWSGLRSKFVGNGLSRSSCALRQSWGCEVTGITCVERSTFSTRIRVCVSLEEKIVACVLWAQNPEKPRLWKCCFKAPKQPRNFGQSLEESDERF